MLRKLKPYVERIPALAFTYRTLRDAYKFHRQRPLATPFGFMFFGNTVMQAGTYEPEETTFIRNLLDDTDVFVDIGANIGYYTCLSRSAGKHTISVEPLAQNLGYLYANLEANGWNDVEVHPVGLADRPGIATLYGGGTGASLISGWAGASSLLQRKIPLSTLDIVVGGRFSEKNMFIKVDVEGAEYDLLLGATNMLSKIPAPVWIMEIELTEHQPQGFNSKFSETFEIFWKHGYKSWTAEFDRREVMRKDIEDWVKAGEKGFGGRNYIFMKNRE